VLEEGKSEIFFFANPLDGVCSWVVAVAEEKRGWGFDRVLELVVVFVVVTEKYDDECDECWRRGENAEK
jgi:hypothetical protein